MFSFLHRINVIGRMREAEAEASVLFFRNMMLDATLRYGAVQHNYAMNALRELHEKGATVNKPNGTTRMLTRMAGEALENLEQGIEPTDEHLDCCVDAELVEA